MGRMSVRFPRLFAAGLAVSLAVVGAQSGVAGASSGSAPSSTGAATESSGTHCVLEAQEVGSTRAAPAPVCFDTFADATHYASHGAINLPAGATSVTREDIAASNARATARAASVIIGHAFDNAEFPEGQSSLTFRQPRACDNDASAEYFHSFGGNDDWNDDIDSALGSNRCHGIYWEHADISGASVGTPWSDGSPLEDEVSSVSFV